MVGSLVSVFFCVLERILITILFKIGKKGLIVNLKIEVQSFM
jgi:hypothetical protein